MRKKSYRVFMGILLMVMIFTTACANNNGGQVDRNNNEQQIRSQSLPNTMNNEATQAVIPLINHQNANYVSLEELVRVLEFNAEWDEETQTYNIGDNDVVYEVKANSKQADKEEQSIELTSVPIMLNGKIMMPEQSLDELFSEEMSYEIRDQQIIIYPSNNNTNQNEIYEDEDITNDELNFEDDPNDPAKNEEEVWNSSLYENSTAVLKNINLNKTISTGKKYLGVKYKFGARPYPRSKRFDCSSFTKFIFAKQGVYLKRISRNQAKQGKAVSRKSLRKGDLLFFYVPGRFKSNKKVGHVGIYMGNKKMLHSSPEPKNGVQITNINKAFWKKTYLKARRVAY